MTNTTIDKSKKSTKRGWIKQSTKENFKMYAYKFRNNKLSMAGLIIVMISVLFALFAEYISPFPEHAGAFVDFSNTSMPPNSVNWFGTDAAGRDVFTRVIFSFRGALKMSIIVLSIAVPFGVFMGLVAGYFHNTWVDTLIMRVTDVFLALPPLILAMSIASMMKPNMTNTMISITITWWPWYTRLVYSMTASFSEEYFVKNAELIGASRMYILFKELLPNCLSPILTKVALDVCWVIMTGASLSFIGMGEQPPIPAFGTMISDGTKYLPQMWWLTIFPAIGIIFIILGFNFLGDGIRDMLDRGKR